MKIVIAGAGAVGTHLAKMLSGEKQDIILMDTSAEKLSRMESNFDLMTVEGNPTSFTSLKDAGVDTADLFVAVTPEESRNVTACILAHSLGARKTVARIDNAEYLQPKHKEFLQQLGVDSLIYPEMLAAREIADSLRLSWIRQWWEFGNGALVMVGVKVRSNAEVINTPLMQLSKEMPYHIVAVVRGKETIIPKGRDMLLADDIVFFTCEKKALPYLRRICGKDEYQKVRNVIIMGGSRIAVRATQQICDEMSVKIIEQDIDKCHWLNEVLGGKAMVINGDARDHDLLASEGIDSVQGFVALTDSSETNILSCLSAKQMGAFKTVAEVESIDLITMAEGMDIGAVINKKKIAASYIYRMLLDADVDNVKCLTVANADVAEFIVSDKARVTKGLVKDLTLPEGCTFGGLIRGRESMLVTGDTQIEPGDHVVVFCLESMIRQLEKFF